MRSHLFVALLFVGLGCSLIGLTACDGRWAPSAIAPARTPLPTWTWPVIVISGTPVPVTLTPTPSPTYGPSPTVGPSPTPSPTARPGIDPTLDAATPDPYITPSTPIPEPMPQLHLDKDIINILLLGRDTPREATNYRTDVIIVASINKKEKSVMLLTIPRDLYVYIPGWTMNRINTAAAHGDVIHYPGGGVALLEQTILYNLGIPIHGWARIDFTGFQNVVDILGGVDVAVTCPVTEWHLKDPALDPQNAENWELLTLEPGVRHLDGDEALWYARSRKRSNDFARSRRQHQVLRAMFSRALNLGMLTKVPQLYDQYIQIVDTDLGLGDVLQFVPLALNLDRTHIKSRFIGRDQVYAWTTPGGANVLLPNREAISALLAEAFQPPAQNMLARAAPVVEIWNGTPNNDWATLAADNLEWVGIIPVIGQADALTYTTTIMYDYTTSPKGSARKTLQALFYIRDANVIALPDAAAPYPFRIILGSDYNPCTMPVTYAGAAPTATAAPLTPLPPSDNVVHVAPVGEPPPGVDGDLSEWAWLIYPLNEPITGRENWSGVADLSGVWNVAWDEEYLYLALRIRDDQLVQEAEGENLGYGDSVELWVDVDPGSRRADELHEHDFHLGITAGNLKTAARRSAAYLWFPPDKARAINTVVVAARPRADGYDLEIAVPWLTFNLTPFAGEGFAFTLVVNDDDTPGSADRQTQVASVRNAQLLNSLTWGLMTLDFPPAP